VSIANDYAGYRAARAKARTATRGGCARAQYAADAARAARAAARDAAAREARAARIATREARR
jgi:hypothetical protein